MKHSLPYTKQEFRTIFSRVPRTCVEVVIRTEDGVLLTLRKEGGYEGQWHIPGGTVYFRESLYDAVKRIAQDELGIEVYIEKLLGVVEYFSEEKQRGYGYSIGIAYLCKPLSTKFTLNYQADKAQFFKTLPTNTIIEQKEFISEYLEIH